MLEAAVLMEAVAAWISSNLQRPIKSLTGIIDVECDGIDPRKYYSHKQHVGRLRPAEAHHVGKSRSSLRVVLEGDGARNESRIEEVSTREVIEAINSREEWKLGRERAMEGSRVQDFQTRGAEEVSRLVD